MDPKIVFARTARGEEELATRVLHLSAMLRRALILIDGHSSVAALHQKAPGFATLERDLEELFRGGFIHALGAGAHAAPAPSAAVASINERKTRLLDLCRELLGDRCAERLSKKLLTAPDSVEGLHAALRDCVHLVRLTIDKAKAEELAARGEQLLH